MLTTKKLDAAFDFKKALVENIEINGLDNTIVQFKAIVNAYSVDYMFQVDMIDLKEFYDDKSYQA